MAKSSVAEKSSGMVHIFSTLANPQKFVTYEPPKQDGMFATPVKEVLIRGGAGIASKNLITPQGVHTAITQEEYDAICDLEHFKQFVERGFIRVERRAHDIDKMVGDMNPRDPGGPLTPADYETDKKDGSQPIPTETEKLGTGWVANQLANR